MEGIKQHGETIVYCWLRRLLFLLPPEVAHKVTLCGLNLFAKFKLPLKPAVAPELGLKVMGCNWKHKCARCSYSCSN